MPFHLLVLLLLVCAGCDPALADSLTRRADFGAPMMHPEDGRGPRIVRFRPGSAVEGADVVYGSVATEKGYRVRTYTSRPRGATGRLPLVVFIPWLSCSAVENPMAAPDGWSKMLHAVMKEGGVQLVRIEKPGVSDSEGPDCSATDLDDDMAAFRAGIRAALADPGVDPENL